MRKFIKKSTIIAFALVMFLSLNMKTYAAPKTMSDGTTFDAEYYAETYADVKAAFGTDEAKLWKHYCDHGKAEGRKASADEVIQVTPEEMMAIIKEAYPEGTAWGMDKTYEIAARSRGKGIAKKVYACMAFANMVSDAIYGDAPETMVTNETATIYLYDIIVLVNDANGVAHAAVVTGINPETRTLTLAEGNVDGKVHYGRTVNANDVRAVIKRY